MAAPTRVLHVSDDPESTARAAQYLEREHGSFEVVTASSVDDALGRLAESDCVVGEHGLRGPDGLDLLDAVREVDPGRPFVLFSGSATESVVEELLSRDATGYVEKGTTGEFAQLADRIESVVERDVLAGDAQSTGERLAELEKRSQTTEALASSFPDLAFVIDEDGYHREYLAGPDSESLLYRDPNELLDSKLEEVLPTAVAERLDEAVQRSIDTGSLQTLEYRLAVPAGTRWFEGRVTPVQDDSTDVQSVVLVTRDVTERVEYERELERQNERFEKLASIMSHDLRNPLNVAMGALELAREEHESERLEQVASGLDRMNQLIDDVLTMVRSGQAVDEAQSIVLSDIVQGCWANVETGSAELTVEDDAVIQADPTRLRHVFENLIRNAVEHGSTSPPSTSSREDAVEHSSTSPDSQARQDAVEHGSTSPPSTSSREDAAGASSGEPSVADAPEDAVEYNSGSDARIRIGAADGGFFVEDDGPGIPPEDREAVFEPGYSTTDGGEGFGLSIVEQMADAHGWEVTVTEGRAGGARFEFSGVELQRR